MIYTWWKKYKISKSFSESVKIKQQLNLNRKSPKCVRKEARDVTGMDSMTRIQTLSAAAGISIHAKSLWERHKLHLFSTLQLIVGQTGLFSLGTVTDPGEGKLRIKTNCTPQKIDLVSHPVHSGGVGALRLEKIIYPQVNFMLQWLCHVLTKFEPPFFCAVSAMLYAMFRLCIDTHWPSCYCSTVSWSKTAISSVFH